MAESIALWVLRCGAAYVAAGVVFSAAFLARGMRRIDPASAGGHWTFRAIVLPGVIALWPLLAARWLAARRARERDAPPDARHGGS